MLQTALAQPALIGEINAALTRQRVSVLKKSYGEPALMMEFRKVASDDHVSNL